jgi:protein required for attachment to host cells
MHPLEGMRNCIIVAVDGSRARIYALLDDDPRNLTELEDLVNPEQRLRAGEIYAHDRPGIKAEGATGVRAGMDEHRGDHAAEIERRFAVDVIAAAGRQLTAHRCRDLVLAAAPAMLGTLRREIDRLDPQVRVHELPKNLTADRPAELHDRLAEERLIPPR